MLISFKPSKQSLISRGTIGQNYLSRNSKLIESNGYLLDQDRVIPTQEGVT